METKECSMLGQVDIELLETSFHVLNFFIISTSNIRCRSSLPPTVA